MNATSLGTRRKKKKGSVNNNRINEKLNHFLLNKLLVLRYHVRKQPVFIKAIIAFESVLIKMHLIKTK